MSVMELLKKKKLYIFLMDTLRIAKNKLNFCTVIPYNYIEQYSYQNDNVNGYKKKKCKKKEESIAKNKAWFHCYY